MVLLIALGNGFAGSNPPYAYGVFYVVVFLWIGLAFPRWTAVLVSPLRIALLVPRGEAAECVRRLHAEFIQGG